MFKILKASSSPDTCQDTSELLFDTCGTIEENGDQVCLTWTRCRSQPCTNHLALVRSAKRLKAHLMLNSSILSLCQKMPLAAGGAY